MSESSNKHEEQRPVNADTAPTKAAESTASKTDGAAPAAAPADGGKNKEHGRKEEEETLDLGAVGGRFLGIEQVTFV